MIAHDRRIAENTARDRQRLYGNTFQRSCDRQRSYASLIPAIQRSRAITWKLGFCIMNYLYCICLFHMEDRVARGMGGGGGER